MKKATLLGLAVFAAPLAAQDTSGSSVQAETSDESLAAAIAKAEQAQVEAREAKAKADAAYAELLDFKQKAQAGKQSSGQAAGDSAKLAKCDDSSLQLAGGLNEWVWDCLQIKSPAQYEATDVAFQTAVSEGDEAFDATLEHTIRRAPKFFAAEGDETRRRASYLQFTVGGFAATSGDGNAVFYDFDEVQSGSGFTFGAEYGLFRSVTKKEAREDFEKGVAKARQACLQEVLSASEPGSSTAAVNLAKAEAQCSGTKLWAWIAEEKNGAKFWKDSAGSLYGLSQSFPALVIGGEFRRGWDTLEYLLPADIAAITSPTFSDFASATRELKTKPYSAKVYIGGALKEIKDYAPFDFEYLKNAGIGAVVSLSYKHEFEFPEANKNTDQTLCLPDGSVSRCSNFNIVAPQEINEWTVRGTINFLGPRASYLPPLGFSPSYTYSFETKRHGFQFPVFFLLNDEKLKGGIKYFYRSKGETPLGDTLDKEQGFAIVLSTEFDLLGGR